MKLRVATMACVFSLAILSAPMVHASTGNTTQGTSNGTRSLLLYSDVQLTPAKSIPFPVLPQVSNWSEVPTVAVKFTTPVSLPKPITPPKEVMAPVPDNIAKRVAAYLFPLNQWEWVYLIAPRGLHGTAGLGNIVLKSRHALVELDTPGATPLVAAGMATQFFPTAGKYEAQAVSGEKYNRNELLHPATVRYEYHHRLAAFSFASTNGKSVYGYNFYTPSMKDAHWGAYGQSAQFVYATDGTEKGLTRWVLQSGLSSFTGIGEPELSGVVLPQANARIRIRNRYYKLPETRGFSPRYQVVNTPYGIAWLDNPPYVSTGSGIFADIPIGPVIIRLSPWAVKTLGGRDVAFIPAYVLNDASDHPWYTSASLIGATGNGWLVYDTENIGLGMNQPARNDLYAVSLNSKALTPKIIHVAKFNDTGGYFFAVGMYHSYVVYDQSTDGTPNAQFKHDIWLVNLDNSERKHLPASVLKKGAVRIVIQGKSVIIPLKQE